ncbi:MAG: hypothetical protein A2341_11210 [Deltaproteobacteria bacterium RIFOXYB12_FULL_58_9]|nr:MAG: hypothetical protein A2341_11210 [Deltaproteobacteria bacterium RIFOXYB12_FULL_58_9]
MVAAVTQGDVQHGSFLCEVDFLPRKHALALVFDSCKSRELEEESDRFAGDDMFGVVEEDVAELNRELLEAISILRK